MLSNFREYSKINKDVVYKGYMKKIINNSYNTIFAFICIMVLNSASADRFTIIDYCNSLICILSKQVCQIFCLIQFELTILLIYSTLFLNLLFEQVSSPFIYIKFISITICVNFYIVPFS